MTNPAVSKAGSRAMRRTTGKVDVRGALRDHPLASSGLGYIGAARLARGGGVKDTFQRITGGNQQSYGGAIAPSVMRRPPESPFRETFTSVSPLDTTAPVDRPPPTYRTETLTAPQRPPELY
jgi:hypothetical protein